jgi:effector-binding domain-containing protein
MPGIESFGRSERELKRRLSEIEERVKQEQKPLGAIGLAIVQASTNARDQAKPMIKAPDEKERIQREIYIFTSSSIFSCT